MKLIRHHDLPAFTEHVRPWLLQHECENCFQLGALASPPDNQAPDPTGLFPLLISIETADGIAGVGVQMHAFGFSITRIPTEAVDLVAKMLCDLNWPAAGLVGPVEVVDPLSDRLCTHRNWTRRLHLGLRVFQLSSVVPPPLVDGQMIPATLDHLDVVTLWVDAFSRELGEPHDDPAAHARKRLDRGQFFLWESNGEPCSIAGIAGPTLNGIRINQVYTPPRLRRRGYASNLVAALSQRMLDSGKKLCFLFTDLANPTSNKIYGQIGYQSISDFRHWRFD